MAANKEFNFKHKEPFETKTTIKDSGSTDQAVASEKETHEEVRAPENTDCLADSAATEKVGRIQKTLIKPKAEPRNKRVQLLLTESNHSKIKEYAENSGTSVNDAINQIIENL